MRACVDLFSPFAYAAVTLLHSVISSTEPADLRAAQCTGDKHVSPSQLYPQNIMSIPNRFCLEFSHPCTCNFHPHCSAFEIPEPCFIERHCACDLTTLNLHNTNFITLHWVPWHCWLGDKKDIWPVESTATKQCSWLTVTAIHSMVAPCCLQVRNSVLSQEGCSFEVNTAHTTITVFPWPVLTASGQRAIPS